MSHAAVACDLDGVIADFNVMLIDAINVAFGATCTIAEFTSYDASSRIVGAFIDDPDQWLQDTFADPYLLANAPLILPSLVALRKIRGMVNKLHVVTARASRPEVMEVTRQWLDMYGIPYDRLVFRSDKTGYCRSEGIRWIIEDNPGIVAGCHEHGIGVFLVDHPYNRDVAEIGGVWRVRDLTVIPDLLALELS